MGPLDRDIRDVQQRLETARGNQDQEAERRAQAELDVLRRLDTEGRGYSQNDWNEQAGTARTQGRTAGQTEERTRWLSSLGLSSDATDEQAQQAVQSYQEWQRGQQTEVQNVTQERDARTQERDTVTSERDTVVSERDAARQELDSERVNNALRSALLAEGVMHGSGENESRLPEALSMSDRSSVFIQRDDSGNFTGVQGAEDAAKALKAKYVEWFTGTSSATLPTTPNGERNNRQQQGSAYKPRYSVPRR